MPSENAPSSDQNETEPVQAVVSYGKRLTEMAALRPDESELILVGSDGTERPVTWLELETRANQIARQLEAQGATDETYVALALPTCLEHILVTLAIWKLGATLLPLRHDIPQWEMDRLLELGQPIVLVSDIHSSDVCDVMTRTDLEATKTLPDGPLPDKISECINLLASSGSTGTPKLIVTPVRGVVNDDPLQLYSSEKQLTILVTSPLYHVNGFNYASPPLLEGGRAIVMEKFDAELAADLIEKHKVTFTVMVPTMLQRIARLEDVTKEKLSSIDTLIYGGAKIPEWVADRWLELVDPAVFQFVYGSSERLGLVQMSGLEWADHRGATGRPVDITISIRDDDGTELGTGEIGHIFMKRLDPDLPMFSYIGLPMPEMTPDGYLTIGDLGSVDKDGYLYVADRRKDMIITGGANVFPAEVETVLSEHPAVVDQVVVPVPDEEWGHRVHAIVQLSTTVKAPTGPELREWCKARLAGYKAPKTYEFVEQVPRSEAGKLNRTLLGEQRAEERTKD